MSPAAPRTGEHTPVPSHGETNLPHAQVNTHLSPAAGPALPVPSQCKALTSVDGTWRNVTGSDKLSALLRFPLWHEIRGVLTLLSGIEVFPPLSLWLGGFTAGGNIPLNLPVRQEGRSHPVTRGEVKVHHHQSLVTQLVT